MIPEKIEKWIERGCFPQRCLLSGGGNLVEIAVEIAGKLQHCHAEKINAGAHADTVVFRDFGQSFKIDFSDKEKDCDQSELENARGIIRWTSQKPADLTGFRIVILENFERITHEAAHSLLKLIEEPPPRVILIFTTRNHHRTLDTILSRMTVVQIGGGAMDFEISDEIREFLGGKNLISKFQQIDRLDREAKNNPSKKINKKIYLDFCENCIRHARFFSEFHTALEPIFETILAISANQKSRLSMERLAMKLSR